LQDGDLPFADVLSEDRFASPTAIEVVWLDRVLAAGHAWVFWGKC
jgi:hypothetical protein